jgi:hypothetical protein
LTEDRAFGADDVAGVFYVGKKLRNLRFLMTDNNHEAGRKAHCGKSARWV